MIVFAYILLIKWIITSFRSRPTGCITRLLLRIRLTRNLRWWKRESEQQQKKTREKYEIKLEKWNQKKSRYTRFTYTHTNTLRDSFGRLFLSLTFLDIRALAARLFLDGYLFWDRLAQNYISGSKY